MASSTPNDLISSFFFADPAGGEGLTYEQLKQRRAIAAAMASKSRDYPNTIGKGIFSFGESLGEMMRDRKLDAEERKIRAGDTKAMEELRKLHPSYTPPDAPAVSPPGPAAAPEPAPAPRVDVEGGSGAAAYAPEVDLSRAQMAESLANRADGAAAAPQPVQMAALNPIDTLSDAGQPGATYGGPSPAGPGASMAERPDQAPPAPSASPAIAAGPGPAGTPEQVPVVGEGVQPAVEPPAGAPVGAAAGPAPGPAAGTGNARDMLAATRLANQGFNPDARGAATGSAPQQLLAQVGGFGGSAPAPAPATTPPGVSGAPGLPALPSAVPGAAPPPGGVRSGAPSRFMPMSEGEETRRFGTREPAPRQWDPTQHERYRRAVQMSQDPNRSTEFRKQAADTADLIEKANAARYKQEEERWKARDTRRQTQVDETNKLLWGEEGRATDPVKVQQDRAAARSARLEEKSGLPAERLLKDMDTRLDAARITASRQEDNLMMMDALKSGLPITGSWAEPRLDAARFGAWALNNRHLAARAGSTELLRAKLLQGVSAAIRDLKPISNVEVQLGQRMVGNIEQQPEVLKALIEQSIKRNNDTLADYDTRSHRYFAGEGAIADTYESPKATWMKEDHVKTLLSEIARNPASAAAEIAEFNSSYGPGSAEFAINRQKLRSAPR